MSKKSPEFLAVAGMTLPLPQFFSSISSVKSEWSLTDLLLVADALQVSPLLVSAYDVAHSSREDRSRIVALLGRLSRKGCPVLLDSGNYEAYWLRDRTWAQSGYDKVLRMELADIAFMFDGADSASQDPDGILRAVDRSQRMTRRATVLPIIHARRENLLRLVREVAQTIAPPMIAVPERELGRGVVERARTLCSIKAVLASSDRTCPLHLLGTGNPLSLLLYSLAGADSFDGLEWCRTVAESRTARLYHFHHLELVSPASRIHGVDYDLAALEHNVTFFRKWMEGIRRARKDGVLGRFATRYLSKDVIKRVRSSSSRRTHAKTVPA